jgi:hypothetical protein
MTGGLVKVAAADVKILPRHSPEHSGTYPQLTRRISR